MERYAITFGEVAIIHTGSTELGKIRENGFSVEELKIIKNDFGDNAELINLSDQLPENLRQENQAAVLVIRNGVNILLDRKKAANKMLLEQKNLD